MTIEPLRGPLAPRDTRALAALLVDAVESGAAVSFVLPLSIDHAESWWTKTVDGLHPRGVVLVARDDAGTIVGSVQLHPAWPPNQPHRADISKLLVHRRCRRAGLGRRLMQAVENAARERGFQLLTLDAKRGAAAEQLYRQLSWVEVGVIPRYAVDPDGAALHDTVVFYKELTPER